MPIDLDAIAAQFLHAHAGKRQFQAASAPAPATAQDAYRVQDRVFAALYAGEPAGAWKVGAARPDLDNLAQVHHGHAVADAFDHRHVVRDEQEGNAELLLQVHQQVKYLGLHGYVQRAHRFISNDKSRIHI